MLDLESDGASDEQIEFVTTRVGETILNVRTRMVLHGLSEGHYTAPSIADYIGCQVNVVADAARELADAGLVVERNPGVWRLTREGWNQVHETEES